MKPPWRLATRAEAADHAAFTDIRYAQCWEDADTLTAALAPLPGQVGVSIASGGENTLALLASGPERIVAIDLNPAQLACLELKVAAFRELSYDELLALVGSRPSSSRTALFRRCRSQLSNMARTFWDARSGVIERGLNSGGKFERYFAMFRTRVLPLVHGRSTVGRLLEPKPQIDREEFYRREWDTWRWRTMFRLFFSRAAMGRLGRDPSFFRYVEGTVADRILARTRHALTALDPAANPYVQWILTGQHTTALPLALRRESFDAIRAHLDRLELRLASAEELLTEAPDRSVSWFNLSDIFEYMSPDRTRQLLEAVARCGRPGARLAYWNTLVPRARPESLEDRLRSLGEFAAALHQQDKAFFYSAFRVEEVIQ